MKRTSTEKPFLSFCMIVRNAERTLEDCLKSVRARAPEAEIVIVDTCSSDRSPEIAQKYADVWVEWTGPKGTWSKDMIHFDDAAAARQKSFELASGVYRAWIDADDVLADPAEAERILKANSRWKPTPEGVKVTGEGVTETLEEAIHRLEKLCPQEFAIYCNYAYRFEAEGSDVCSVWQERERIVRWDPKRWKWAEAAHEILVPIDHRPVKVDFAHLLFVHKKKFTEEDTLYAINRHWDVMYKQYEAGDITTRRSLYLAEYAKYICPERELEFIKAAYDKATTPLDRMRCKLQEGLNFASRGLMLDAGECFSAATYLRGDLPDAWFAGAEQFAQLGDAIKAIAWIENGLKCAPGQIDSFVNPRHQAIKYPTLLCDQYRALAKMQISTGLHDTALQSLKRAAELMVQVYNHGAVASDADEARGRYLEVSNEHHAQEAAMNMHKLVKFLLDNDESEKALKLVDQTPWNLKDHPLVIECEVKVKDIRKHMTDPEAYRDFYGNVMETGFVHSLEEWLTPKGCIGRTRWAAEWINKHCPNATVLDVGCYDGIIGIPLLEMCPGIQYIGVDVFQQSIDKFRERVEARGLSSRVALQCVPNVASVVMDEQADVALWFEVIEHVPDPKAELHRILHKIKPQGHVLLTTPWGSFDHGHPPAQTAHKTPRDPRGHLRAMLPDDIVAATSAVRLIDTVKDSNGPGLPNELRAVVQRTPAPSTPTIHFCVPSALWDWSGSTVMTQGMGASEKAIVQIAGALAVDRSVDVYGPVPDPEVFNRVGYWPLSRMRKIDGGEGPMIISRQPSYDLYAQQKLLKHKHPMYLWLQDAWYPELNADVAARYEKIITVSNWHKQAMHDRHGVPLDKMIVAHNPLVKSLYTGPAPARNPHAFVYSSSPDRGLIRLLEIWPKIQKRWPDATLDIFYGWKGCTKLAAGGNAAWVQRFESMRKAYDKLRFQPGVRDHGMQSPEMLAHVQRSASIWAQLTTFEETDCATAAEARAAGLVPVCPPLAGLAESANGLTTQWLKNVDDDAEVLGAIEAALAVSDSERAAESERALAERSVEAILPIWRNLLCP